jgi:hypothetical protein
MGGIFSTPKTPKAPDPAATVLAEQKANQINQFTPYGNLRYGQYDSTGKFKPFTGKEAEGRSAVYVEESPYQRAFRTGGEGLSLGLINQIQQQGAALPQVRSASGIERGLTPLSTNFSGDARRAQQSFYEASASQLRPEFDRQRGQIEQRLADQGLPVGSKAYQEELNRLEQQQGSQLSQLSQQSVQAGSAEADRLARLAMALQGQQFNTQSGLTSLENQARAGQFGELGTLFGLTQPFQQYNTPQIDVGGIYNNSYQNQLARSQMIGQQKAQTMQTIGQIGGYMLSDERLKEGVSLVGNEKGHNIYEFNYLGEDTKYRGVMAQEVQRINPDAVTEIDGYLAVNYDMIGLKCEVVNG